MFKLLTSFVDAFRAFFAQPAVPVVDPNDPTAPGNWADPALLAEVFGDDDVPF